MQAQHSSNQLETNPSNSSTDPAFRRGAIHFCQPFRWIAKLNKLKGAPLCIFSQLSISYTIRENPNSANLWQAAMWVGEWPHFGTLGSGRTLLAQKMNGLVSALLEKLKNGVILLLESEGNILDGQI